MNDQSQMMNWNFGKWPPPKSTAAALRPRYTWKGKKPLEKRRNENSSNGYRPPNLRELQFQNRKKARKFYPKKKLNRFAPYAPRNTTSFIIRAKRSGGIAPFASPCPVTPAVLPTPNFSPSREVLGDMAKEEWGVDGYGSMKGLIKLRSPGHENLDEDEDEGSSESDVEEHIEVERRLDHDLSRFEIVYPNFGDEHSTLLENRVGDQDMQIAQLEEENLTLKEKLFLMASEMEDLRRRLQHLETGKCERPEIAQNERARNEESGDLCLDRSDAVHEKNIVYEEKNSVDDEKSIRVEDKVVIGNEENCVGD